MASPQSTDKSGKGDYPWWLVALLVIAVALAAVIVTNDIYTEVFNVVLKGIGVTIFVTLMGFVLATTLGLGIALMALSEHAALRQIARFYTEYQAAWDYRYLITDARAIGDDRVLVQARISAKGHASGAALEGDIYHCFWLRHGRFIRVEDHLTAKGALHALGLSGETLEAAGLRE